MIILRFDFKINETSTNYSSVSFFSGPGLKKNRIQIQFHIIIENNQSFQFLLNIYFKYSFFIIDSGYKLNISNVPTFFSPILNVQIFPNGRIRWRGLIPIQIQLIKKNRIRILALKIHESGSPALIKKRRINSAYYTTYALRWLGIGWLFMEYPLMCYNVPVEFLILGLIFFLHNAP